MPIYSVNFTHNQIILTHARATTGAVYAGIASVNGANTANDIIKTNACLFSLLESAAGGKTSDWATVEIVYMDHNAMLVLYLFDVDKTVIGSFTIELVKMT